MRAIVLTAYVAAFLAGPICQIECLPFALADAAAAQDASPGQPAIEDCPHHQAPDTPSRPSSEGSSDRPAGHRDHAAQAICLDAFSFVAQSPNAAPQVRTADLVSTAWMPLDPSTAPQARRAAGIRPAKLDLRAPPPKIYLRDQRFLN